MNASARVGGIVRTLALLAAAVACGTITWEATTATADAQTASASALRQCVPAKAKKRKSQRSSRAVKNRTKKTGVTCKPQPGGSGVGSTNASASSAPPVSGGNTGSGNQGSTAPCRTSVPGAFLTPRAGSRVIWSDDCTAADPLSLYGAFVGGRTDGAHDKFTNSMGQIAPDRLAHYPTGGPGGGAYRQLTVHPEDQNWSAPRDALGYNWASSEDAGWGIPGPGPTVLWHEGEYRVLTTWVRLGEINDTGNFRQLLEIKQSEPFSDDPAHGAMFELQQREGSWMAICEWSDAWVIPVTQKAGEWVPISVEGFFTADSNRGWLRLKIGDRTSPVIHRQTLLRDSQNGQPVPSFMEMGPYQASALPKFSMGFADVNVYGT